MLPKLSWCVFLVLITCFAGCDAPPTPSGAASTSPAAPPPPPPGAASPVSTDAGSSATANGENADDWTQQKTEAWVRQVYKLEELTITELGPKKYKGTGKSEDGRTYTFSLIEELPDTIKCEAKDDQGGSGTMNMSKKMLASAN